MTEPTPHTINSIADLYRVHRNTVRSWILTGKLKAKRTPGGHYRITDAALLAFEESHMQPVQLHN